MATAPPQSTSATSDRARLEEGRLGLRLVVERLTAAAYSLDDDADEPPRERLRRLDRACADAEARIKRLRRLLGAQKTKEEPKQKREEEEEEVVAGEPDDPKETNGDTPNEEENKEPEKSPKPTLKCVRLDSLLRPDVVEKMAAPGAKRSPKKSKATIVISSDDDSSSSSSPSPPPFPVVPNLKPSERLPSRYRPRVRVERIPRSPERLERLLERNGLKRLEDERVSDADSESEAIALDCEKAPKKKSVRFAQSDDEGGENRRAERKGSSSMDETKKKLEEKARSTLLADSSDSDADFKNPVAKRKRKTRIRIDSEDDSEGNSASAKVKTEKPPQTEGDKENNSTMRKSKSKRKNKEASPPQPALNSDAKETPEQISSNDTDSEITRVESASATEKKPSVRFAADILDDSSSDENVNGEKSAENAMEEDTEPPVSKKTSSKKASKKSSKVIDSNSDDGAELIEDGASETLKENEDPANSDGVSDDEANRKEETLGGTDSNDSEVFKAKTSKRKKKKISDGSGDDSSAATTNKKKRRRIKNVSDGDSDSSKAGDGSDSEGEGKKHGRKNIRKVKKSGHLDEATRTAARKERERIHRIAERQRLYNESMFDESGRPDEVKKLEKVDLDFDPETKEPIISIDRGLVAKLKPHQANGIKFMWDACFESVKQIKEGKGSGCILAHCMGLGKTLQVVTLVHTLLTNQELTKVERVLVVCPLSTVLNWVNEFNMWLKFTKCKDEFDIYEISKYKQNYERANKLKEWLECGGVCVLGYDMFRNLSADNNKKFKKAQLNAFQRALVDPGPDLVVCDEGHLLKNEKTSLSQAMNKVKTLRRIVLTGTPLQNNLKEYYCMVQFVKPNLLGKYNEYLNRFVNPITNGQYTDSTEHDIRVMKRRSHVLHKMLDGAVQRRDYAVLAPFLPPKHEYVLFISLTEIQIKLYQYYMDNFSRRPQPDRKNTGFLFPDFQALQRIWTHPLVLKANSERYEIMQQKKRDKEEEEDSEGSLVDFIDDEDTTTPDESSSMESSDDSDASDRKSSKKKKGKANKAPKKRITRATAVDSDEPIEIKPEEPVKQENPTEWWMSLCSEDELNNVRHSYKLLLLLDILKMCEAIGDKLLVFSQSLYSLDLIEQFLWKIDEATQKNEADENLAGHMGSWSPGIDYFRLDGSTSCENRSIWCKNFNKEDNPRARLFLISTRAGGLGINLVAANRVVIFDMSWNPSHDVQSIFRVYRFGQKKPCYVYRFLALGTMEEKIYERQVTKQAISKRVIDEQQIDRHYAESDLAELYNFCPVPEGQREVPKLPKDRLFADLLKEHDTKIYKYHEHDSLLENKEEETLTEEERKAAWEDYENEKTRPPPTFGANMFTTMQQQQYMAMNSMLQQDYPQVSDQLAGMLPTLIQQMYQNGGDSGLLQKLLGAQTNLLGGGYKYPQMNPGMMINPGNMGAGPAVSAAAAPQMTWQQQQKIQLQRLQQQQAMQANLKYYAGGLGSRDTMDMAALQQRQRALMMASNPVLPTRGRPRKESSYVSPVPIAPGEIVDLDSE